ncbi:ribonucleoside-diphosphate reductase subunit alpha [Dyella marensis]|jgi:ribonucleoside-diphosphate reductase alpha chain|uniref:Ribonucleoside-diphosphate reductase n=2 Tax=Rhodanobacteraceae TaxID=1775411 RepID=A0A1I2HAK1_9GAMM|nr:MULTISPECIES: ribonucleoside-diphosphate reductase subunit alpha [Dyella]SFF27245.1 ribonucleoside-diphosphate reductase alpha chain [Dyella marensis]
MQPIDTDSRERTDDRADASAFPAADAATAAPEPVRMEAVAETPFALTPPHNPGQMRVKKRNGSQEIVDVNKIVRAVTRSGEGLHAVDPLRVALKTIGGLYDGATTRELDELSIRTAAALTAEEPEYGQLAARLLGAYVDKEVSGQEIQSFSQSIARGAELGILNERLRDFVAANARKLNDAIDPLATRRFEYFGLRTVYDRYLLRHPQLRKVIETPQYFFMRIACALGGNEIGETLELYRLLSSLEYMASSPTLFNAGTAHEQLSSCFLLDSPTDSLESIYEKYGDVAKLSKFAGGIGLAYSRVRSRGSLIRGTNGHSNGLVPWLKTLDASVAAVNQGGKRKGAACVYLEPWHADIEEFLELRDNTGDEARRTHNLNLANWIPDEFMRRVETDAEWSLFDPKIVPHFVDSWGETFERAYREAEAAGLAVKKVKARELYARMLRTLAQTGNGWMTFKDRSNATSNQTAKAENVIHLSNLCTEILEVTSAGETAVCNLGSVNLARHVVDGVFDFDKLASTVRTAVRQLDRVIDLNFYPIDTARTANRKWRPVGLGVMGLQDVFFKLRLPFDSAEALALSTRIAEEIYFHALTMSNELAQQYGAHPGFAESRAANGELQFDYWPQARPNDDARWASLRASVKEHGLRNSLLIAIAPTATIASISGCYECIEPQVSNLFKRETLSGDFLVVNRYLVEELKTLGLWTPEVRDAIKLAEGSIQGIANIPERLRQIYRTVWELPQKALIDLGAARGAYIDQSQSLNLFMENPNIGQLSSMYMYAWKSGIKTTYYLRSRPATKIAKTTVSSAPAAKAVPQVEQEQATAAVFCSLENPEYCEACQ